MKHIGSITEFYFDRMDAIMRVYDQIISQSSHIIMPEVYNQISQAPAPRFYVSDERALAVIKLLAKGDPLNQMNPLKAQMFRDLANIVNTLPNSIPLVDRITQAIHHPAPSFYLSPGSIKIMVCKYRNKWTARKMEKLRHGVKA